MSGSYSTTSNESLKFIPHSVVKEKLRQLKLKAEAKKAEKASIEDECQSSESQKENDLSSNSSSKEDPNGTAQAPNARREAAIKKLKALQGNGLVNSPINKENQIRRSMLQEQLFSLQYNKKNADKRQSLSSNDSKSSESPRTRRDDSFMGHRQNRQPRQVPTQRLDFSPRQNTEQHTDRETRQNTDRPYSRELRRSPAQRLEFPPKQNTEQRCERESKQSPEEHRHREQRPNTESRQDSRRKRSPEETKFRGPVNFRASAKVNSDNKFGSKFDSRPSTHSFSLEKNKLTSGLGCSFMQSSSSETESVSSPAYFSLLRSSTVVGPDASDTVPDYSQPANSPNLLASLFGSNCGKSPEQKVTDNFKLPSDDAKSATPLSKKSPSPKKSASSSNLKSILSQHNKLLAKAKSEKKAKSPSEQEINSVLDKLLSDNSSPILNKSTKNLSKQLFKDHSNSDYSFSNEVKHTDDSNVIHLKQSFNENNAEKFYENRGRMEPVDWSLINETNKPSSHHDSDIEIQRSLRTESLSEISSPLQRDKNSSVSDEIDDFSFLQPNKMISASDISEFARVSDEQPSATRSEKSDKEVYSDRFSNFDSNSEDSLDKNMFEENLIHLKQNFNENNAEKYINDHGRMEPIDWNQLQRTKELPSNDEHAGVVPNRNREPNELLEKYGRDKPDANIASKEFMNFVNSTTTYKTIFEVRGNMEINPYAIDNPISKIRAMANNSSWNVCYFPKDMQRFFKKNLQQSTVNVAHIIDYTQSARAPNSLPVKSVSMKKKDKRSKAASVNSKEKSALIEDDRQSSVPENKPKYMQVEDDMFEFQAPKVKTKSSYTSLSEKLNKARSSKACTSLSEKLNKARSSKAYTSLSEKLNKARSNALVNTPSLSSAESASVNLSLNSSMADSILVNPPEKMHHDSELEKSLNISSLTLDSDSSSEKLKKSDKSKSKDSGNLFAEYMQYSDEMFEFQPPQIKLNSTYPSTDELEKSQDIASTITTLDSDSPYDQLKQSRQNISAKSENSSAKYMTDTDEMFDFQLPQDEPKSSHCLSDKLKKFLDVKSFNLDSDVSLQKNNESDHEIVKESQQVSEKLKFETLEKPNYNDKELADEGKVDKIEEVIFIKKEEGLLLKPVLTRYFKKTPAKEEPKELKEKLNEPRKIFRGIEEIVSHEPSFPDDIGSVKKTPIEKPREKQSLKQEKKKIDEPRQIFRGIEEISTVENNDKTEDNSNVLHQIEEFEKICKRKGDFNSCESASSSSVDPENDRDVPRKTIQIENAEKTCLEKSFVSSSSQSFFSLSSLGNSDIDSLYETDCTRSSIVIEEIVESDSKTEIIEEKPEIKEELKSGMSEEKQALNLEEESKNELSLYDPSVRIVKKYESVDSDEEFDIVNFEDLQFYKNMYSTLEGVQNSIAKMVLDDNTCIDNSSESSRTSSNQDPQDLLAKKNIFSNIKFDLTDVEKSVSDYCSSSLNGNDQNLKDKKQPQNNGVPAPMSNKMKKKMEMLKNIKEKHQDKKKDYMSSKYKTILGQVKKLNLHLNCSSN